MGRGIRLTEAQWDELDALRLTTPSADVFRNCLIILKSDVKETIASIARQLGCTPFTVVRIQRLYRQGGVKALRPIKPPGRTSIYFSAVLNEANGTHAYQGWNDLPG